MATTKKKVRPTTAGTDYRQVRARRLMDAFDEVLGGSSDVNLSFLLEAEREVSVWLGANSRPPTDSLLPEDLTAIIRETRYGILSTRFSAALWVLRERARPGKPRVTSRGELVLDSDAPLSRRLPDIVKVLRATSSTKKDAARFLEETSRALSKASIDVPAELRSEAVEQTIAARKSPWRTRPASAPATLSEVARDLGVSTDALRQVRKRERRKAGAAGIAIPRKSANRKK